MTTILTTALIIESIAFVISGCLGFGLDVKGYHRAGERSLRITGVSCLIMMTTLIAIAINSFM